MLPPFFVAHHWVFFYGLNAPNTHIVGNAIWDILASQAGLANKYGSNRVDAN